MRRHLAAGAPAVVVGEGRTRSASFDGLRRRSRSSCRAASSGGSTPAAATCWPRPGAWRRRTARGPSWSAGSCAMPLLERSPARHDLDVVVEGDALAVARALADAAGRRPGRARALPHRVGHAGRSRAAWTSSRHARSATSGRARCRTCSRRSIAQDLRRRDFTVNALAVELASGASACSIRSAAAPTWRGAGCASCTRCRSWRTPRGSSAPRATPPAWASRSTRGRARCQALALSLAPYPALSRRGSSPSWSGSSPTPSPPPALTALARAGAFRLLDAPLPDHARRSARGCARCRRRSPGCARAPCRRRRLELLATALAADQPGGGRRRDAARARPERRAAGARAADAGRCARRWRAGCRRRDASDAAAGAPRGEPDRAGLAATSRGDAAARERLDAARRRRCTAERPALGGDDVIALGVPPGPEVAAVLAARARRPARGGNSRPAGRNRLR